MADTLFVSQLGTSVSGATGVVFALMAVINAFGFMFGHGAGSNISRKLGAHDLESARVFASTSFFLSLLAGSCIGIFGFLFHVPFMRLLGSTDSILPYALEYSTWILIAAPAMASSCVMNNILRYEGKAFFAMLGLASGGVLNIFGDMFLIFGLNLGVRGAGISTAVSQYISMPFSLCGNMLFQSIGQSGKATFLSIIRSGLVFIPVLWILSHLIGLFGIQMSQTIADGIAAAITIPMVVKFLRRMPEDGMDFSNKSGFL